jgi:hypothetical protein
VKVGFSGLLYWRNNFFQCGLGGRLFLPDLRRRFFPFDLDMDRLDDLKPFRVFGLGSLLWNFRLLFI